jgi:hypothetical protein
MAPIIPQLILTDMQSLFQKIKIARVATVNLGVLRFIGYEESRIMFEERTGKTAREVMIDGQEVRRKLVEMAHGYGLDTSGACLSWKPSEGPAGTLEYFGS